MTSPADSAEQEHNDDARENTCDIALAETERRLDSYYEEVHPGDADSPIKPLTTAKLWPIIIVAIVLTALWLVGRFVVMPLYY